MHGNYRLIKKDGRIGWNALEKQAVIELLDHNVNEPEGAVSVWFMSLEELCTTLRYDNFRMHNQFYDNYAIISDQREVCDHDNATFCINWNCGWYPQLSGKFFKGAIYPTGYAPVPKAIVTAGHCSLIKKSGISWYLHGTSRRTDIRYISMEFWLHTVIPIQMEWNGNKPERDFIWEIRHSVFLILLLSG